jgi:hypothetical protein
MSATGSSTLHLSRTKPLLVRRYEIYCFISACSRLLRIIYFHVSPYPLIWRMRRYHNWAFCQYIRHQPWLLAGCGYSERLRAGTDYEPWRHCDLPHQSGGSILPPYDKFPRTVFSSVNPLPSQPARGWRNRRSGRAFYARSRCTLPSGFVPTTYFDAHTAPSLHIIHSNPATNPVLTMID